MSLPWADALLCAFPRAYVMRRLFLTSQCFLLHHYLFLLGLCKSLQQSRIWFRDVSGTRLFNLSASPRLVLHFESGGFLVFYNCRMHWCSAPSADPASDILSVEFHRGRALDALRTSNPICYTLLDQRYFSGLGEFQDMVAEQEMEEGRVGCLQIQCCVSKHLTP